MTEETIIPKTKCPICGQPATMTYKPFCSKKCADIDLGRWLKGNYIVHTNEEPQDGEIENLKEEE